MACGAAKISDDAPTATTIPKRLNQF